jgi:hypothetical protein
VRLRERLEIRALAEHRYGDHAGQEYQLQSPARRLPILVSSSTITV